MKKIFLFVISFLFIFPVSADIYISKKDIDTNEYINDSNYLLYDDSGAIVDSWIQNNNYHVVTAPVGSYKLVLKPLIAGESGYFNETYSLDVVSNQSFEFILHNNKIATPDNLSIGSNNIILGAFFIFLGLFIIFYRQFYNI